MQWMLLAYLQTKQFDVHYCRREQRMMWMSVKESVFTAGAPCGLRGVRIDTLCFLAGCRKRRLNRPLSVLSLSLVFECVHCAVN